MTTVKKKEEKVPLTATEGTVVKVLEENPYWKAEAEVKTTITVTTTPRKINWTKPKMSYDLWRSIVTFCKESYKEKKTEAQLRLYIHRKTGEWTAWAFPQEAPANSLTVSEITDHPKREEQMAQFGTDWIQIGTAHHHCAAGASQSGTDKSDEIGVDGLHFTIGNVDKNMVSIHSRFCSSREFYAVDIRDFVDLPETNVPRNLQGAVQNLMLKSPEGADFPQIWIDNMEKKTWGHTGVQHRYSNSRTTGVITTSFSASSKVGQKEEKKVQTQAEIAEEIIFEKMCEDCCEAMIERQKSLNPTTIIGRQVLEEFGISREELASYLAQ